MKNSMSDIDLPGDKMGACDISEITCHTMLQAALFDEGFLLKARDQDYRTLLQWKCESVGPLGRIVRRKLSKSGEETLFRFCFATLWFSILSFFTVLGYTFATGSYTFLWYPVFLLVLHGLFYTLYWREPYYDAWFRNLSMSSSEILDAGNKNATIPKSLLPMCRKIASRYEHAFFAREFLFSTSGDECWELLVIYDAKHPAEQYYFDSDSLQLE